jgi:N-acetylglucosaminyl-diphospho-decaprenol L-rhamnosyltransferase
MSERAGDLSRAADESWTAELGVVIVNYNTGLYLERCLRALEAHRGSIEADVLVIDNASRDESHLRAVRAHPSVRLIENHSNRFLAPAWNQGIRETAAPFVLLLNPDTQWWAGTLGDYLRVAVDHPRAGIVGPMIRTPDGAVYPSGRPFPTVIDAFGHAFLGPISARNPFTRRYHMDGWDRTAERVVDWVSGSCMLIRRDALDEVGLFDESFPLYGEELDMATRLKGAGWDVLFTPEVEILHEEGVSTRQLGHRSFVLHSRSIHRYYRKHRATGWRRALLPIAWVVLRLRAETAWAFGRRKAR